MSRERSNLLGRNTDSGSAAALDLQGTTGGESMAKRDQVGLWNSWDGAYHGPATTVPCSVAAIPVAPREDILSLRCEMEVELARNKALEAFPSAELERTCVGNTAPCISAPR